MPFLRADQISGNWATGATLTLSLRGTSLEAQMALDTQPSSAKVLEQLIERVWHVGNCIERSSGSVTSSPCCCVPPG